MGHVEFRDATPDKHREAMEKLRAGIREAQQGQLAKAVNLFKEVLAVVPCQLFLIYA